MRAAIAAVLVGAAFVLSGCQYLLGMGGLGNPILEPMPSFDPGEFGSFDPGEVGSFDPGKVGSFDPTDAGFSLPPPLAIYTAGTATVTIDGTATTLGQLTGSAASYADFGTEITWTDGKGLYLRFGSGSGPESPDGGAFVLIDRIEDGQHWMTSDPTHCPVTVTQSDAKGVAGSASCKGLRWVDAISASIALEPAYIAGQAQFDAEVTFKATP